MQAAAPDSVEKLVLFAGLFRAFLRRLDCCFAAALSAFTLSVCSSFRSACRFFLSARALTLGSSLVLSARIGAFGRLALGACENAGTTIRRSVLQRARNNLNVSCLSILRWGS